MSPRDEASHSLRSTAKKQIDIGLLASYCHSHNSEDVEGAGPLIPNRFDTDKIPFLGYAGLLGLGLFLSACGGSSGAISSTPTPAGPSAISNGASLSSATSHWVSANCGVQVELTSDYGFWSVVVSGSGTSSGSETWAQGTNSTSVTVGPGVGLQGFFWVSALGNITGSTSSQAFTANVSVKTVSTAQSLGSCTFSLAGKTLS